MISVYRKISGVETEICTLSAKQSEHKTAIRGLNEIQISITVDVMLPILEGDYIKLNGVNYTINRDVEYTIESDVKYSYDLVFEHPFYILLNKLYCSRITGHTSFTLTGKLRDFVELLVWCVNISPENPDGVDTGWTVGEIFNTEYKTLTFQDMYCNEVLNKLSDEFQVEYFFNNKQVNFVERIERLTDHVFEHGAGKGLYKLTQQNVDKEDTVTRLLVRGGNQNVPNGYADEEGYLKLPENYLEDFSEHAKVVERKKKFEEEFPRFVGSIATVSGENNKILTCPQIDFDIAAIAVGDNVRINFLTGDLMGVSMKFNWQNSNKQITLIEQEDETALAGADGTKPTIPNTSKKAKVGDEFNFTGVLMPESYVTASITRLRNKGNKYLGLFSKKRVKFTLDIDHRYMRGKPELIVGDLVVISIPQRNFNQVIRIAELGKNLHTGAISATVSNYLEENWEKYVESKVENVRNDILAKQANVRNTLETIFRDGIVTESELKSIEAILTNLSVERGQLNAQYLVVRGNVNLINKTPLETAWSNYQTAFVDVETAINNAITDKLISDAEKANIDNKISVYSTRTNEFATALENARVAIEDNKNQGVLDVVDQNRQYLQDQIDGVVDNWFYPYSPTLANYPASDWTTNTIKDRHIGDTFTNTAQAPATDAGKSWRFVVNAGVYSWTQIADSDAVLALQKAAQAQSTADGKSTTYLIQPSSYKFGDMWVLAADQTVNGVAYKSGEILTATQDSTTFVQAHWVKKVRYTDDTAVNNLEIGGRNYFIRGNINNLAWTQPNNIVSSPSGRGFSFPVKSGDYWTLYRLSSVNNRWRLYWLAEEPKDGSPILSMAFNGDSTGANHINTVIVPDNATWGFIYLSNAADQVPDIMLEKGNKATDWSPAPEDVQAAIDAAVVKATYWSVKASAPVIYKDAINAATSGTHTPVTVSGELRSGTTTTSGGFITVTPNGGTEAGTASASPITIAPANGDGKTSYTVRLYDTAAKTTLLDTMTIPVVFKGASGVNAINVVLSNEADVLPASTDGTVSDYSGSGTIIRVFEGATELDYDGIGTANGKFNVTASATGITAGAKSESGLTCVFANASNMTADNATITFTIIGKTSAGASFSLIKTQTFAKSRTGQKGDKGDQGLQGIQGTPGSDGITYYTWVRYADTPTTGMSQYPTGKSYIGFAYNKTTATESSNYADYKWSLIKGEQGIPGENGADGTQYYTWIKYADTPTSGMSDNPAGKAYIGIAVNKTTATESTNYADYTWQLTKGEKGDKGDTGLQGLQGLQGEQGIQGFPGSDGLSSYAHIAYADNSAGAGFSQNPTGKAYIGMYTDNTVTDSTDPTKYKWSLIKGADGAQGIPGAKGADGQTPYLHIAYALNATGTAGFSVIDSANKTHIGTYTDFIQADSTDPTKYKWSLIKGADGISITLVDVEFAKNTSPTTAPTTGWTTTAPTLLDGEQLWTRTKTAYSSGNPTYSSAANITPKTGATGQGIDSVTEQFILSSSKITQPAEGDVNWSTTPPTWENGKYIWSRVKVVYKNPTSTVYTGYAVSSEWEAVNNVQIGGRNLIAKKYIKDWNLVSSSIVVQGSDDDGDYLGVNQATLYNTVGGGAAYNDIFQGKIHYNEYTQYALKIRWKMAATQAYNGLGLRFKYSDGTYSEYISLSGSDTTLTEKSIISEVGKTVSGISCSYGSGANRSLIYDIQMTEGNKHTAGYSVAPEDVQAEIDAVQSNVNTVSTSVSNLNTYVTGAFKDGLIDEAEAKAIEKYKNSINESMSKAEASFLKVFANTYLEGTAKIALENAKINLWGQRDTLLTAINTAIAGGTTTPAQKTAVDNAFTSFNSLMSAFQSALEEANKAIQAKLDNLSKGYVDELEIGGVNLLLNSKAYGDVRVNQTTPKAVVQGANLSKLTLGKWYMVSFDAKWVSGSNILHCEFNGSEGGDVTVNTDGSWKRYSLKSKPNATFLYFWNASGIGDIYVRNIKIEEGDKATPWTEAPEDVQAAIDTEKTRINDILSDNVADPSEKQYLSNLWQEIYAEYPRIWAQANDYSVDKSNYEAKYTALNNLLSPVLANLTVNTTVSGASIRTAFSQYYDARIFLQNAITNKVNQNAGDAAAVAGDAQAKANTAKAVTDKFGTTQDGGLISTVMILLRELNSIIETAGISGIQGALKNYPSMWSGGTYAQAMAVVEFLSKMSAGTTPSSGEYDNLAKITFLHNGAAKVGDFIIEESGRIVMVHPDTGKERLVFNVMDIPLVADLMLQNTDGDSVINAGSLSSTTSTTTLPNTVTVTKTGSELTVSGTCLVSGSLNIPSYSVGEVGVSIYLYKNGAYYQTIISDGDSLSTESPSYSNTTAFSKKYTVDKGTYSIVISRTFFNCKTSSGGLSGNSTLAWSFVQSGVRYFQFGLNGFMAFFENNHAHFTELEGWDLRGKTNMPGVLLSGSVGLNGGFNTVWGAKKHASSTAIRNALGQYTVYHSVGHSDYSVQITSETSGRAFYVPTANKGTSSFVVYFTNLSGAAADANFSFQITGRNY